MQVAHVHLAGEASHLARGSGDGGVLGLVQIMRLDIAPQEKISGGEMVDVGLVAHGVVRLGVEPRGSKRKNAGRFVVNVSISQQGRPAPVMRSGDRH